MEKIYPIQEDLLENGDHHPTLSPSSFPKLKYCPHFKSDPFKSSVAADRGTRIHRLTAYLLAQNPELNIKNRNSILPCTDFTEEEKEKAEWLASVTAEIMQDCEIWLESKYSLYNRSYYDKPRGECITFGTIDCSGVNSSYEVTIIDFKSGRHNDSYIEQLKAYYVMVGDAIGTKDINANIYLLYCDTLEIISYNISYEEAYHDVMTIIDKQKHKEDYPLKKNPHCEYCANFSHCDAWKEEAAAALVPIDQSLSNQFREGVLRIKSDPELLAKFMTAWKSAEKIVENAELSETLKKYLDTGYKSKEWKLSERESREEYMPSQMLDFIKNHLPRLNPDDASKFLSISISKMKEILGCKDSSDLPIMPYKKPPIKFLKQILGNPKN